MVYLGAHFSVCVFELKIPGSEPVSGYGGFAKNAFLPVWAKLAYVARIASRAACGTLFGNIALWPFEF